MSISERQQQLVSLLESNVFCTVEYLAQATYTSPSSIRRDLTQLQNMGLIRRTHGGAALSDRGDKAPTLQNRLTKNVAQKRIIARKASVFLRDGQRVLLDGSTTASFLLPYIAQRQGIEIFTNGMLTAVRAIELGITTHCIGGRSVRQSPVLAGEEAYQAIARLHTDILFFSSLCLDIDGVISDPTQEENYLRQRMLRAADQTVFLCDSDKFGKRSTYQLASLSQIDSAVFDSSWPELQADCRIL